MAAEEVLQERWLWQGSLRRQIRKRGEVTDGKEDILKKLRRRRRGMEGDIEVRGRENQGGSFCFYGRYGGFFSGRFSITKRGVFGEGNSLREPRLAFCLLEEPGMYTVFSSSLIIH